MFLLSPSFQALFQVRSVGIIIPYGAAKKQENLFYPGRQRLKRFLLCERLPKRYEIEVKLPKKYTRYLCKPGLSNYSDRLSKTGVIAGTSTCFLDIPGLKLNETPSKVTSGNALLITSAAVSSDGTIKVLEIPS